MTTKELEDILYFSLWKQGTYMCFEVAMPNPSGRIMKSLERVDMLSYETKGIWRFYELKVSKSDFHSKHKVTFLGHYNYYVMPFDLYNEVQDEIPDWVGVYAAHEGGREVHCVKRPKKQELKVDPESLMFNFMQALSRENTKYRKYLRTQHNKNKKRKSTQESGQTGIILDDFLEIV